MVQRKFNICCFCLCRAEGEQTYWGDDYIYYMRARSGQYNYGAKGSGKDPQATKSKIQAFKESIVLLILGVALFFWALKYVGASLFIDFNIEVFNFEDMRKTKCIYSVVVAFLRNNVLTHYLQVRSSHHWHSIRHQSGRYYTGTLRHNALVTMCAQLSVSRSIKVLQSACIIHVPTKLVVNLVPVVGTCQCQ